MDAIIWWYLAKKMQLGWWGDDDNDGPRGVAYALTGKGFPNHNSLWERWLWSRATVPRAFVLMVHYMLLMFCLMAVNLGGALLQRAVQQCRSRGTTVEWVVDGNNPVGCSVLEKMLYFTMRCSCNGGRYR